MNIVVFASDSKGLSSLNNIINILNDTPNVKYFAMVCPETRLHDPIAGADKYKIYSNCNGDLNEWSDSLQINLPFSPDWLIVNREKWDPELRIIKEFKQKFQAKVAMVEPNAQICNNIETILEVYSKNKMVPFIDVFFEHSTFIVDQKKVVGFEGNSIVVGNPKYDRNLLSTPQSMEFAKNYYKIDPNKKQVLIFSLQNTNRNNVFKEYRKYIKDNPQHQYFFKPYPGEPSSKYAKDYFPKFMFEGVTPIMEEAHIWPMFNICDIHLGSMGSIIHASLLLEKELVDFSKKIDLPNKYLDVSRVMDSKNIGIEDSKEL